MTGYEIVLSLGGRCKREVIVVAVVITGIEFSTENIALETSGEIDIDSVIIVDLFTEILRLVHIAGHVVGKGLIRGFDYRAVGRDRGDANRYDRIATQGESLVTTSRLEDGELNVVVRNDHVEIAGNLVVLDGIREGSRRVKRVIGLAEHETRPIGRHRGIAAERQIDSPHRGRRE